MTEAMCVRVCAFSRGEWECVYVCVCVWSCGGDGLVGAPEGVGRPMVEFVDGVRVEVVCVNAVFPCEDCAGAFMLAFSAGCVPSGGAPVTDWRPRFVYMGTGR